VPVPKGELELDQERVPGFGPEIRRRCPCASCAGGFEKRVKNTALPHGLMPGSRLDTGLQRDIPEL